MQVNPRTQKLFPPSREEIALLPIFPGLGLDRITLVLTATDAAHAYEHLNSAPALGFDTESKPSFVAGTPKTGPHLIQLATEKHAFLFLPHLPETLPPLAEILGSQSHLKVGFGLGNDRGPLANKLKIKLRHTLDLGSALRSLGYAQQLGLRSAVAVVLGQRMLKSKSIQTSNWGARTLSPPQLIYAANDAYASLMVYLRSSEKLPKKMAPESAP